MLEDGDVSLEHQPEFLNVLGKMCRQLKTIPDSLHIENCSSDQISGVSWGGGGIVSRGAYRGRPVAVKTLHLYLSDNFEEHFGVNAGLPRI